MKFLKSLRYALNGIRHSIFYEANFRIQLFATFAVMIAGYCFDISPIEWLVVIGCCMLVLAAEMINTAIEALCNYITDVSVPAIKVVKDVAAGAVLITAIGSAIIGMIIFLPRIINAIRVLH